MARLTRDHAHVYPQEELAIPAFTLQPESVTALRMVLVVSHPAEGRRLSWPGLLGGILGWFVRPKSHLSQY